jgi:hypothetical protein
MRALSADRALQLPVRLHGITLGRPVDLLLDAADWRVVGFDVLCGDEIHRFLPFATTKLREDAIVVASALMLLEDLDFYRTRSRSFRSLLGSQIELRGKPGGALRDLLLTEVGTVSELVLERRGSQVSVSPEGAGLSVAAPSRDAA